MYFNAVHSRIMLHDLVLHGRRDVKEFEVATALLMYGDNRGRRIDHVAYLRKGFLRSMSGCVQMFESPAVTMYKLVRAGLICLAFRNNITAVRRNFTIK